MIEDNALNSTKNGFNDDAYGYDFCALFFHLLHLLQPDEVCLSYLEQVGPFLYLFYSTIQDCHPLM